MAHSLREIAAVPLLQPDDLSVLVIAAHDALAEAFEQGSSPLATFTATTRLNVTQPTGKTRLSSPLQ